MNERTLKFRIGLFIVGATILLVGSLFFFGLVPLFQKNVQFVSFFAESVRGLNEGSLVRFRGVPVGQVVAVKISLGDGITANGIPVIYEINSTRLQNQLGVQRNIADASVYEEAIRDGLTAKLENESLVTGQLYIDLDFRPNSVGKPDLLEGDLREVPSVPSLLSDVTERAVQVVDQFSRMDLPGIASNLNQVFVNINRELEGLDASRLSDNLNETLDTLRTTLESDSFQVLLANAGESAREFGELAKALRSGDGPIGEQLVHSFAELNKTLESVQEMTVEADRLLSTSSQPIQETTAAMREIQRTAQAMTSLLNFLERNPNALLFGRENP